MELDLVRQWDEIADRLTGCYPRYFHAIHLLGNFVDIKDGWVLEQLRVADVGCGQGRLLELLHIIGFKKIVGIEFSPKLADMIRRRVPCVPVLLPMFTICLYLTTAST